MQCSLGVFCCFFVRVAAGSAEVKAVDFLLMRFFLSVSRCCISIRLLLTNPNAVRHKWSHADKDSPCEHNHASFMSHTKVCHYKIKTFFKIGFQAVITRTNSRTNSLTLVSLELCWEEDDKPNRGVDPLAFSPDLSPASHERTGFY